MKTQRSNRESGLRYLSSAIGIRIFSALISFGLVTALVTGCASYFDKTFSGISRTYEAWKNVKPGTRVTFKGTIRYGGRDFPVEIQHQLVSPGFDNAELKVTYFVAGRPAGNDKAYIRSKDYGPMELGTTLVMLTAAVPPSGSFRKTIFSMRPTPGILETFVFEPQQKTFQFNGKSVSADRYTLTTNNNGFVEQVFAWFSPEVPGGWISIEKPSRVIEDLGVITNRKLFSGGQHYAASMFQHGERFSLQLVSVEEH